MAQRAYQHYGHPVVEDRRGMGSGHEWVRPSAAKMDRMKRRRMLIGAVVAVVVVVPLTVISIVTMALTGSTEEKHAVLEEPKIEQQPALKLPPLPHNLKNHNFRINPSNNIDPKTIETSLLRGAADRPNSKPTDDSYRADRHARGARRYDDLYAGQDSRRGELLNDGGRREHGMGLRNELAGYQQRDGREGFGAQMMHDRLRAEMEARPINKEKYTLVLCTWSGDGEGYPRVQMLVASIQNFAVKRDLEELIFVVPAQDKEVFDDRIADGFGMDLRFNMRVVTDETLLKLTRDQAEDYMPASELRSNGGRGVNYRRQMLLKLGIATVVQTSYYVTLDNDVFMKRPVGIADLVPNGKGLVQGYEHGRHRSSWWEAAGSIVESPVECGKKLQHSHDQIGVTPAVLHTGLVRELLQYLSSRMSAHQGNRPWDLVMFDLLKYSFTSDWTEYTLYWAYGCRRNLLSSLHTTSPTHKLYDTSAFSWHSFDNYDVDKVFGDTSTYFGVIQSINGASSADVIRALHSRFL